MAYMNLLWPTKMLRRLCKTLLPLEVPLLRNREFSTLALGQGYPRLRAFANNKNVCHSAMSNL